MFGNSALGGNLKEMQFLTKAIRLPYAITILSSLLLSACLGSVSNIPTVDIPPPKTIPVVRAPAIGQQWVYEVRNVFNGELVDVLTETDVEIISRVCIAREWE